MNGSAFPSQLRFQHILFVVVGLLCLAPWVSAGLALVLGIFFSIAFGNPYLDSTRKFTTYLLQISIVGMGAGMSLDVIGKVGFQGIGYTAVGLSLTLALGLGLGKVFQTDRNTSLLVTVGTAICGGSAIAAVAPLIRAKAHEISMALAAVFLLNASAVFIFPALGHWMNLTQEQFGLWSALAIHDTSSVVGAALQYGEKAVEIATPVKLARALWIIPVSLCFGFSWNRRDHSQQSHEGKPKAKRPWFILGFVLMAAVVTWIPSLRPMGDSLAWLAKRTLVLTLFLIGSGMTRATLQSVGLKPFLQGILLWAIVSSGTLFAIYTGWIS